METFQLEGYFVYCFSVRIRVSRVENRKCPSFSKSGPIAAQQFFLNYLFLRNRPNQIVNILANFVKKCDVNFFKNSSIWSHLIGFTSTRDEVPTIAQCMKIAISSQFLRAQQFGAFFTVVSEVNELTMRETFLIPPLKNAQITTFTENHFYHLQSPLKYIVNSNVPLEQKPFLLLTSWSPFCNLPFFK